MLRTRLPRLLAFAALTAAAASCAWLALVAAKRSVSRDQRSAGLGRVESVFAKALPDADSFTLIAIEAPGIVGDLTTVTCQDRWGRLLGTVLWDSRGDRPLLLTARHNVSDGAGQTPLEAGEACWCASRWAASLGFLSAGSSASVVGKPVRAFGAWRVRLSQGIHTVSVRVDEKTGAVMSLQMAPPAGCPRQLGV